jgi:hypothetical protein
VVLLHPHCLSPWPAAHSRPRTRRSCPACRSPWLPPRRRPPPLTAGPSRAAALPLDVAASCTRCRTWPRVGEAALW